MKKADTKEDIPSVYIDSLQKYLILRNIPDDNSCLFNSISYALSGANSYQTFSPPSDLRQIVVSYIEKDPALYSEAVLGRPRQEYCEWILKKDSWGGAIELGILADWFDVRITCIDIELGNFIQIENESKKPKEFIVLIYSGIHYDVFALNANLNTTDKELDQCKWRIDGRRNGSGEEEEKDENGHIGGEPTKYEESKAKKAGDDLDERGERDEETAILKASEKLCKLLQERDYSTNTTTFRVRCLDCYLVLVGEVGASKHAEQTGHLNFGEVKKTGK